MPLFDQKRRHVDITASAVRMRGLVPAAWFLADDVAAATGARCCASVADSLEQGDVLLSVKAGRKEAVTISDHVRTQKRAVLRQGIGVALLSPTISP